MSQQKASTSNPTAPKELKDMVTLEVEDLDEISPSENLSDLQQFVNDIPHLVVEKEDLLNNGSIIMSAELSAKDVLEVLYYLDDHSIHYEIDGSLAIVVCNG